MIDLTSKHIIVTGGEPALIRGIIKQLQTGGADISLVHHNQKLAKMIAEEFTCHTLILDWENLENVREHLRELDGIHGAVICPEWHEIGAFVDTSPSDWDRAMRMNYENAVYLSQAIAERMISDQIKGSIIFLTSVATLLPMVDTSIIGTSLATLRPLAKMAAVDCGEYGIRVNMIAIGWINTESNQQFLTKGGQAFIEQGIPLRKIGKPESVGDACCFLMSDLARYMTGTVLTVDGGYTLTRSEGSSPYPSKSHY